MNILALDFGGVLFHPLLGYPMEGAIQTVKKIVESKVYAQIYIISKPAITSKFSHFWMSANDFWSKTGLDENNLRYVKSWQEKAILSKELGVTHFVDNRIGVLHHMHSVRHLFLFRPAWWELKTNADLNRVTIAKDWSMLGRLLLEYPTLKKLA